MEDTRKVNICCICGKVFTGWGNNPWPVCVEEEATCCDECNWQRVIPARIEYSAIHGEKKNG